MGYPHFVFPRVSAWVCRAFHTLIRCVGGKGDGNWVVVLPGSLMLILSLRGLGLERLGPSARQRGTRGSSVLQETSLQGEAELKDKFTGKPKDCDPPPETCQYLKEKSPQEILTGFVPVTGTVSLLTLCTTEFMECCFMMEFRVRLRTGMQSYLERIILLLKPSALI